MKTEEFTHKFGGHELPVYLDRFYTSADMICEIRKRSVKKTHNSRADYFSPDPVFCRNMTIAGKDVYYSSDLMKALKCGAVDKESRATLRTMKLKPLTAEEEATSPNQRIYSYHGNCPKVGRMLSGDMRCMVNYKRPPCEYNAVKIGIDLTIATVFEEYYPVVGRAVARAVISLERMGYHIGLITGSSVMTNDRKRVQAMTRVLKKPDDDFNIGKVMFPLTERAYQKIIFGWIVRHPKSNNRKTDGGTLGYVVDGTVDEMEDLYDIMFGKDSIHINYQELVSMVFGGKYDEESLCNYLKALIMG